MNDIDDDDIVEALEAFLLITQCFRHWITLHVSFRFRSPSPSLVQWETHCILYYISTRPFFSPISSSRKKTKRRKNEWNEVLCYWLNGMRRARGVANRALHSNIFVGTFAIFTVHHFFCRCSRWNNMIRTIFRICSVAADSRDSIFSLW